MTSYTAQSREAGRADLAMNARRDRWWVEPLIFAVTFGLFVVYTTYRTFENQFYVLRPDDPLGGGAFILSPFYSPLLPLDLQLSLPLLGVKSISPAIYILVFPLAFRMTCYYYRKAYYRSYFLDPPGCAVSEPLAESRMRYTGERAFPFILQNLHRYAFYIAVVFIVILTYDAVLTFIYTDPATGRKTFGMSLASLVFTVNIVLLAAYTFGCHSCRHLVGGGVDCYSCSALNRTRHGLWRQVTYLNERHAQFALSSMIWVGLTDLFVNLVARGILPNVRFF